MFVKLFSKPPISRSTIPAPPMLQQIDIPAIPTDPVTPADDFLIQLDPAPYPVTSSLRLNLLLTSSNVQHNWFIHVDVFIMPQRYFHTLRLVHTGCASGCPDCRHMGHNLRITGAVGIRVHWLIIAVFKICQKYWQRPHRYAVSLNLCLWLQ